MSVIRFFHSTSWCRNINKSALATLRKKTGFSIANIRKALDLNNNDPAKAEEWLKEQAKALGWNKAMKLQNRQATQGLIGVALKNKKVAMVEVNCETDFVARNEKFRSFVELVTKACLQIPILKSDETTSKVNFNTEEIRKLKANDNLLADELALLIGSIGENLVLKRAFCFETTKNDVEVAVAVHPPVEKSEVLLGKFGTFISFQRNSDIPSTEATKNVPENLCKHIIGMNPDEIGEYEQKEEDEQRKEGEEEDKQRKEGEEEDENKPEENEKEEKILLHQDYILDESMTVGELLKSSGIILLDFKRYGCGDEVNEEAQTEHQVDEKKLNASNT